MFRNILREEAVYTSLSTWINYLWLELILKVLWEDMSPLSMNPILEQDAFWYHTSSISPSLQRFYLVQEVEVLREKNQDQVSK